MESSEFDYDIFISYAHLDNEPIIGKKVGWVNFFEDLLRQRLRVRLGKDVVFFRDAQLRNFGTFSDQLAQAISKSAVLVSILSPRYVDSPWCLRELSEFCKSAGTNRVIKIAKTAYGRDTLKLEAQTLLRQVKDVLEIRFYKEDESSLLFTDLTPEIIEDHIPECYELIDKLAQNLKMLLKDLSKGKKDESEPVKATTSIESSPNPAVPQVVSDDAQADEEAIAVYLAETTKDMAETRTNIRNELQQFNYRVLPDSPLPQDPEELIAAIGSCLDQAKLSIHLIGAKYGGIPEGEKRSIPHIQYDMAAARVGEGNLEQMVWMPIGLTPKEKSQEEFIQYVKNSSTEYLQNIVEDLKTEIMNRLKPEPPDPWAGDDSNPIHVCLYCHEHDFPSIAPLYSYLTINEAFNVKLPLKEATSIEEQIEILKGSDAVILYYGSVDKGSFVNILKWVNKNSASRSKILAIYAGLPATTDKELLVSNDPIILKNFGEFDPQTIEPFLQKLKAATGGDG